MHRLELLFAASAARERVDLRSRNIPLLARGRTTCFAMKKQKSYCMRQRARISRISVHLTFADEALLRERQQAMTAILVAKMHIILRLFGLGLYDKRLLWLEFALGSQHHRSDGNHVHQRSPHYRGFCLIINYRKRWIAINCAYSAAHASQ